MQSCGAFWSALFAKLRTSAESWAMLSMIYRGEFAQGYNAGPNPLDRALAAAQRAVDLAPY